MVVLESPAMKPNGRRLLFCAAACVGAALGAWVWETTAKDQLVPRRFVEVSPGLLYRSGEIAPRLIEDVLRENHIDLVVALLHDADRPAAIAEREAARALGIERIVIPLRGDGTGRVDRFAKAVAAIARARQQDRTVLVHCAAGARRAGAVVATYLLLVEGAPAEVAWRELSRFGAESLEGSTLLPFLNENLDEVAARLLEWGVIDRPPGPLPVFGPTGPAASAALGTGF
jgi:protein tyrosine phosphatase (PTP) superfamily phosphohydrolase (DUF442 family)